MVGICCLLKSEYALQLCTIAGAEDGVVAGIEPGHLFVIIWTNNRHFVRVFLVI